MNKERQHDYKAWANKLKERHEAGEVLSLLQVKAYQEALAETESQDLEAA